MIFYTADLHFGYDPILDFRPFDSVEEMDRALIENWNSAVSDADTVYVIGDLGYNGGHVPCRILSQLAGHKHLIRGNHDTAYDDAPLLWRYFESITDFLEIDDGDTHILLSHYPMLYAKQGYMLHGHLHNVRGIFYPMLQTLPRVRNAGADVNGYKPVTLAEILANNESFYSSEVPVQPQQRPRSGNGLLPPVPDFRPIPEKPLPHKKHLFLTGCKHIGKSTVLRRLLHGRDAVLGGFYTLCERSGGRNSVYLCPADDPVCTPERRVFYWENGTTTYDGDRFSELGCKALAAPCDLLLMDELGPKERNADAFREGVLRALDGDTPVYGVLQQAESPFLEAVRSHPEVEVITVTEENRDALPQELLACGW